MAYRTSHHHTWSQIRPSWQWCAWMGRSSLCVLLLAANTLLYGVRAFLLTEGPPLRPRRAPGRSRVSKAVAQTANGNAALLAGPLPLQLYNTATRKKEPFQTVRPGRVSFYSCGPTVYDYAHIGNFRAFLTYDVLKRWLRYCGYEVEHVCNLTDIDDKIIRRMARDKISLQDLTDKYAQIFFEDLHALNIVPASRYPRATEHVNDIVDMVEQLVQRGFAYESRGSYYFRVSKWPSYGRLANLDFEGMQDGASEGGGVNDSDEYVAEKGDAKDFALWKAYKEEDGPVFWETRLGKGRPGWHIECSAMARRFLGTTIDLHAGGVDLVFPHHENEIAQSEAATGEAFCNCWIHNGFVNVNNEKMSKSKGNFLTLRGTLRSDLDLRAFRYLVVTSQYRNPLNFNSEALDGARKTLRRLDKLRTALLASLQSGGEGAAQEAKEVEDLIGKSLEGFEAGMRDDLNTPRAAAAMFTLVKGAEKMLKGTITQAAATRMLGALDKMDTVLGVFYEPPLAEGQTREADPQQAPANADKLPPELQLLIDQRAAAKAAKDWTRADEIRDELRDKYGLVIKDIKGGGIELIKAT